LDKFFDRLSFLCFTLQRRQDREAIYSQVTSATSIPKTLLAVAPKAATALV